MGTTTAWRYAREGEDLLAATAPTLAQAMRRICTLAFVILDGTLIAIDRLRSAADRAHYSGKHKRHGVNVQVIADPLGRLIWLSPALPGAVHDLKAARHHGILAALTRAAMAALPIRATAVLDRWWRCRSTADGYCGACARSTPPTPGSGLSANALTPR